MATLWRPLDPEAQAFSQRRPSAAAASPSLRVLLVGLAFAFVAGELGRRQPAVTAGGMLAALLEQVRADRREIEVVAQPRIAG
jgi:hypothetical protein